MEIKSKKLNSHISYNNYRSFIPNNIFSPNQLRNLEYDNNYEVKNTEKIANNSLKTLLIMNYSKNNLFEGNINQNNIFKTKYFKGGKISSKKITKKENRINSRFSGIKTCKVFFDKTNKINESTNRNSANNIFNIKITKIKKLEHNLNRSCPIIGKSNNNNKQTENSERNNDSEKTKTIKGNREITSKIEDEKNFSDKKSNIYKIEYLKKIIRKHYFENFENLKDYFNNICGKDNYINIDDIIFYLKEIIRLNIDKKELRQLLYINGIIRLDFNNFKFIFFPDLKQDTMINLKLKNEKRNFLKNKFDIKSNEIMPNIKKNESEKKENDYKQNKEKSRQKNEISQKLKIKGLNTKMKFLIMDINKDFIIKRFNERYMFNKKYLKLNSNNKFLCNNINIYKKYDESKRIKKIVNNDNEMIINEKINKNNNDINKENLKLYILKIDMDINKLKEIEKNKTTNNNLKEIKKIKIEDNYNSKRTNDNSNKNLLNHKLVNTNRYLRNEIKNIDFIKNENETASIIKLSSFSLNKTKDTSGINLANVNKHKSISQIKDSDIQINEILNQDKPFLFFNNENDNNLKEISSYDNLQIEKESKINKNSDILNFL